MNDQSIFVKIEKHEEIQTLIKNIKQRSKEAQAKLQKIRDFDKEEEQKLTEFDDMIDHININLDQIEGFMKQ
ncbi:MAG: hypothetical protein WC758_05750 [Candidatus Woesearchaeota archaeon]|jgi:hypothetical protein